MRTSTLPSASIIYPEMVPTNSLLRLDKNELSEDMSSELKLKVLNRLMDAEWNRYPAIAQAKLEAKVADYAKLTANQIALAPGSASIIANLLNAYAIQKKNIVIVQPTYALFDAHCRNYNLSYTPWMLNDSLEFDFENTPILDHNSVLFITSPNNPVGNSIDIERLEELLNRFPKTQIVLDNVYYEFSDTDFSGLINQYNNLMIIRSFSKAFPLAGVRLGYICATTENINWFKSLSLNYSLNHFTLALATEVLFDSKFINESFACVSTLIRQRELLSASLLAYFENEEIEVFRSQGNFILIRLNASNHAGLLEMFRRNQVQVLDASGFPLLENCLRISIGTAFECAFVLEILIHFFEKQTELTISDYSSTKICLTQVGRMGLN